MAVKQLVEQEVNKQQDVQAVARRNLDPARQSFLVFQIGLDAPTTLTTLRLLIQTEQRHLEDRGCQTGEEVSKVTDLG